MSKFFPSQRFSPGQNRVNDMKPLCASGTITSAKDPGKPMLVPSLLFTVAHPSTLPKHAETIFRDHPQRCTDRDLLQRPTEFVYLGIAAVPFFPDIAVFDH